MFPGCQSRAASLSGTDIYPAPGWAIEVKGRRDFSPTQWSKQATKNSDESVYPVAIMRPDGYGEARVGEWLAFMTLADFRDLLLELHSLRSR